MLSYTQSSGYLQYDSSNSTELEWSEADQIDILYIVLFDIGITMGKPDILAVANKVKNEGV